MRGCQCRGPLLCAWCAALAARAVGPAPGREPGSGVAGNRGRESADTPGSGSGPEQAIARPHLSEAVFQAAVIELAKRCGYLVYFTKDSRRSPSGFPDLVLAPDPRHEAGAHPEGRPLYAIELKTDVGQLTRAQQAWLAALAGSTGVVAACWRPSQWSAIVEQLRGER